MSFTAVINGQGNFTASVNGSAAFNVSVPDSPTLNVGMAAMGPTGLLSADAPLIYDGTLKHLSIEPDYYALKVHTHQISDVIGLQQALDGLQPSGDYATNAYVNATFQPIAGMSAYYLASNPAGYITNSALAPYITASTAAATYYPLTNPAGYITTVDLSGYATESWVTSQGYITSAALSPYLLSTTAASTYQLIGDYATNTDLTNGLATKANVTHTHDASAIVSGVIDLARIPIIPSQIQVVSTQNSIANLTASEQAQITGAGVLVTTTDGNRWVYSGSGSKTSESSYVKVADITPDWTEISNKPAFGTMSLEATTAWLSKAGNLSGLANTATARTNLGLGTMAVETATNYLTKAGNLSGLANLATSRTNLGLGTMAVETATNYLAKSGNLSGLANLATARSNLGLGSMAVESASSYYLASNPSGYITSAALSGYATEYWVQSQGYITSVEGYLPLSGGTMTGNILFGTGGQYIGAGTFDTGRGGANGISLTCSVGYEFNWQAGWLATTEQFSQTRRPLYLDSGSGTHLRAWHSSDYGTEVSYVGITFPDNTQQTTAANRINPPTDQTQNWVVVWHQADWYTTEYTRGGVLLNDATHKIDFLVSGYPRVRVETAGTGTELMTSGIKFPDGTEQYTASTGGGPLPPLDTSKPWLLSWDTTNLIWAETTGRNGLIIEAEGHAIDFGFVGTSNPAMRWTNSGFSSWMEINPDGLKFPDGTTQTTAPVVRPIPPSDTERHWIAAWHYNDYYSTEATGAGVLLDNGTHSIDFDGSSIGGMRFSGDGRSSYLTVTGGGITFPDSTTQTTAAITFDPTGYATESWVTSQAYITSADLAPYLTSATAASTYFPIPTGTTSQYIDGTGVLQTFPTTFTANKVTATVYNQTGSVITKGQVVYINGAHGNLPTVALAIATGDSTSAGTYGLAQSDIADMSSGTIVIAGVIENIDTFAYEDGDKVYLSPVTAGGWTTTKPYAPDHLVYIGVITRKHPTQGTIQLRIANGFELSELHDVQALSPSNADGLFFDDSDDQWKTRGLSYILGSGNETLGGLIKDGLVNANAPSSSNPYSTLGDVESSVNAYAASITPVLPTTDEKSALSNANLPSASNPYLTLTGTPVASETTQGIIELANKAEAETPTSSSLGVSPVRARDFARRFLLKRGIVHFQGSLTTQVSGTGASYAQLLSYSNVSPANAGIAGFARGYSIVNTSDPTHISANGGWLNFSKEGGFAQAAYLSNASSSAGIRTMMIIGEANSLTAGVALGDPTNKRIGVSHTSGGNILLMVHNGTTLTFVDSGATPPTSGNRKYYIEVTWDGTGYAEMYVKDALGNEFSCSTTNAPIGSPQSIVHSSYCLQVSSSTTHTATVNLSPSNPAFYFA